MGQDRQPGVGKTHRLEVAECAGGAGNAVRLHLGFQIDDGLQLLQEPAVDLAAVIDLVVADAETEGLGDLQQAIRRRGAERSLDGVAVVALAEPLDLDLVEPLEAGFERAQGLLQGFRKCPSDGHGFADRFHGGGQRRFRAGEFLERETRDLGHHVIDGGLEGGRGRPARDVVGDLVHGVADGELRRDLGDGKAGGLRGKGRGARHARVHLDDDHAAVFGIDGELHVGAARLDADLAQNRQRGVAHDLVFLVGERQRGRDGDGIARVDAHRIDVLDGADDDAVIRLVADDLHLVFLPAEHTLLDQHLIGGRRVEAALDDVEEFLTVVGDAAARPAHGEGRAQDGRQARLPKAPAALRPWRVPDSACGARSRRRSI